MELENIAERVLWLADVDKGSPIEIRIEIGRPQWKEPEIEAMCLVFVRGLMDKPLNIYGSDLLNALECGLEFIQMELKNRPENEMVQWPGGEPYFD